MSHFGYYPLKMLVLLSTVDVQIHLRLTHKIESFEPVDPARPLRQDSLIEN